MMDGTRRFVDALQRQYLALFLVRVFATLHEGQSLSLAWYLLAMARALERAAFGNRARLVVSVPPRHLKSITAAVALVAWLLGRNPGLKIIVAAYSAELAREHSEACRTVMESEWYQRLFPGTRISRRNNRQDHFRTTVGGSRRAISVSGTTTGLGADLIILDDCMKADEIASEAAREALKNWYSRTLLTRLNSKKKGSIISIQQRLGEDDLTAKLLEHGFEHLCLPAIAECEEVFDLGFGRSHVRRPGELLDPDREDMETLEQMRREMGPALFNAQYQQKPVPPEGNLIRIDKFARYEESIERDWCLKIVQSWDTGMSDLPTSDWSVCTTWGYREEKWYLLDVFRQRLAYPELRDAVLRLKRQWAADKVVIEDAGSGKALWQELWRTRREFQPVMIAPRESKEERLIGKLGLIEDGRVVIPTDAPWLDAFLGEMRAFPNGRHDDQVDSMSQFLEFALSRHGWFNEEYDPKTGRKLRVTRREAVLRR